MAVRVKYTRTELSEGEVDIFDDCDYFVVQDDNTIELRERTENNKYRVVGYVHPNRWESIIITDREEA